MKIKYLLILMLALFLSACKSGKKETAETEMPEDMFTGAKNEVRIMTLDPGHFHAALVQKKMYEQVDPTVYVYAP